MHVCLNCGKPIRRYWPSDNYSNLIHWDIDTDENFSERCADGSGNNADSNDAHI